MQKFVFQPSSSPDLQTVLFKNNDVEKILIARLPDEFASGDKWEIIYEISENEIWDRVRVFGRLELSDIFNYSEYSKGLSNIPLILYEIR